MVSWSTFVRKVDQEVDLPVDSSNDFNRLEKIDDAIGKITAIVKAAEKQLSLRVNVFKKEIPDKLKLLIRLRNVRRRLNPLIGAVVYYLNSVISTESAMQRFRAF